METVYIETTIVSYLVAKPSKDSILAAHQTLTRQWWQEERLRYHCVTSQEVLRKALLGDMTMSRLRTEVLSELIVLAVDDAVHKLARELLTEKLLPPAAASDAIHAVVASLRNVNNPADLELPASGESASAWKTPRVHATSRVNVARGLHSNRAYGRMNYATESDS